MRLVPKLLFIFLSGFLLLGCDEDDSLHRYFGEPCIIDPFDRLIVGQEALNLALGECQVGRTAEGENAETICKDYIGPANERCDGLDNNCSGTIDDPDLLQNPPWASDNPCKQCGKCIGTWEICVDGNWKCAYLNGPPTPDTVCDGIDNDCDCRVDEAVSTDLVFCYDHDEPETAVCGECRVGYEDCDNGQIKCVGAIYPTPERCDSLDNDCNCIVDDTDVESGITDILFEVDTSGSMFDVIDEVTDGVCAFAISDESDIYRFALVLIATPDGDFSLVQNFDTADKLCEALQNLAMNGGIEPTLSANLAGVNVEDNPLLLDWRDGARKVIVGFGDEPAWDIDCSLTFNQPCLDEVTTKIIDMCLENEVLVYWFQRHVEYYQDISLACGGNFYFLHPNQANITDNLNEMFEELCVEAP